MFSYYGSKSRVVHLYPRPLYPLIIEPFAGSARYAVRWHNGHKVWINDIYDAVYRSWKFIQSNREEILGWPPLVKGEDVRNRPTTSCGHLLLGFIAGDGQSPRFKVSEWGQHRQNLERFQTKIRRHTPYIKVTRRCYSQLPDAEATWFIDPPYNCAAGKVYPHSDIDYDHLRDWIYSRRGQVIVCENSDSEQWMKFKPLATMHGSVHKTLEMYWYQHPSNVPLSFSTLRPQRLYRTDKPNVIYERLLQQMQPKPVEISEEDFLW